MKSAWGFVAVFFSKVGRWFPEQRLERLRFPYEGFFSLTHHSQFWKNAPEEYVKIPSLFPSTFFMFIEIWLTRSFAPNSKNQTRFFVGRGVPGFHSPPAFGDFELGFLGLHGASCDLGKWDDQGGAETLGDWEGEISGWQVVGVRKNYSTIWFGDKHATISR